MKMRLLLLLLCFLPAFMVHAQNADKKDAPPISKKDSLRLAKFKAKGTYPLIKASPYSGVLPVSGITEKPDAMQKYKLVFSLTTGTRDADKIKEVNRGLAEIGRIINLHIAAGVSVENLDIVIVTHGQAMFAILNEPAFKKEFKSENPNLTIIKELESAGARFVACGQAMQFLEIKNDELLPSVKVAIAAKVALSTYQQKGYTQFEIDEE